MASTDHFEGGFPDTTWWKRLRSCWRINVLALKNSRGMVGRSQKLDGTAGKPNMYRRRRLQMGETLQKQYCSQARRIRDCRNECNAEGGRESGESEAGGEGPMVVARKAKN
jgi:hypothetical protein